MREHAPVALDDPRLGRDDLKVKPIDRLWGVRHSPSHALPMADLPWFRAFCLFSRIASNDLISANENREPSMTSFRTIHGETAELSTNTLESFAGRFRGALLRETAPMTGRVLLHCNGALHGIDGTGEIGDDAIAGSAEDAPAMGRDALIKNGATGNLKVWN